MRWVAEIQSGRSPAHTRHTLTVMSQMLNLAVRDGSLVRNVADGIAKPRLARPVQRFLSLDEVGQLAAELPAPYDLMVVFLAFMGLRFGEVAGLRVRDVDLERGRVNVNWSVAELADGSLHRDAPRPTGAAPCRSPRSSGNGSQLTSPDTTLTTPCSPPARADPCATRTSATTSSTQPCAAPDWNL